MFDSLFLHSRVFAYCSVGEGTLSSKNFASPLHQKQQKGGGEGEFLWGRGDGWRHTINMYEIQHIQRTRSRRRRSWEWEGKTQNHDEDLFSPFSSIDAGAMFESELLFDTMAEREQGKLVRFSHIDFSKFTNLIKKILFLSRVESSYVALIYSLLYIQLDVERREEKIAQVVGMKDARLRKLKGEKKLVV